VLIDVHAHAQPPEYLKVLLDSGRYEVERGLEDQLIVKEKGSRILTVTRELHAPADRVADMAQLGVDLQVLSLTAPNVYFLEGQACVDLARLCNDFLAGVVSNYPDRFRALASVPLTADIDSAMAELVRCMDVLGMPGFLIGGNINGVPLDDPRFDPLYEEANRRGALMFLHPMPPPGIGALNQYALAPLVGFAFDTTLALARLIFSNFFGRFLNITVVAAQLGGALPFLAGRLDAGWQAYPECQGTARPPSEVIERIYYDTTSADEAALRLAIDTVGPERVLFGSDYPHLIGEVAGGIETVNRSAARRDRGKILGDNAARLYGLVAG
jgi:aminocarboxymuconate-semialdehyde decarboxylase